MMVLNMLLTRGLVYFLVVMHEGGKMIKNAQRGNSEQFVSNFLGSFNLNVWFLMGKIMM